ncbi:FAD:protein FMN transferase [Nocardioides panacis]|uniref:FAD:protein FMN transferase n=1 Tax=Nocardioides panacis TaxID=2849501 RepID=A0A975SX26_9ACTN|nr:FAD:protein FMN transferase [Nocardioides panacis]QWZ07513.1 FAD:protein FMN transferase [Nocardioides panacis]
MATTTAAVEWELWSTRARLVVTNPGVLGSARELVDSYLAQVDDAANRFRADSEICRLAERSGEVTLSPTMAHLVAEALAAAELTDGDVDPTVGGALRRLGYDRDLQLVTGDAGPLRAVIRPVPGYRRLRLEGSRLRLPAGVELDLGATAKAVAADRAAELVHGALGTGVLVSLGGDIATAGPAPAPGWQVHVQDRDEDPWTQVELPAGSAIATSSTVSRRWVRGGCTMHHIVDPRTGQPARPFWRSVTVAAGTCAHANAVTTASLVRGERAVDWVRGLGLPARFLRHDGVLVHTDGWPTGLVA